ncbi:MAG: hypothetical protein FWG15_01540 [Propionibacteriaceae bacterium]|nr:hypothetical protein [Propionibacteriaceae bacterium]
MTEVRARHITLIVIGLGIVLLMAGFVIPSVFTELPYFHAQGLRGPSDIAFYLGSLAGFAVFGVLIVLSTTRTWPLHLLGILILVVLGYLAWEISLPFLVAWTPFVFYYLFRITHRITEHTRGIDVHPQP